MVSCEERERVLKEQDDALSAGHYEIDGMYDRISKWYYWIGMRRYITEYIKNCPECCRYKPSSQKPSELLQTPIYNQQFETFFIDLFGPLPKSSDKQWIFINGGLFNQMGRIICINLCYSKRMCSHFNSRNFSAIWITKRCRQ